ncbi:hypothetical protein IQ07DRAFT_638390 [Pyrenochaeta sp. DS3sAY3a]|nr:hypothetical protein IQ07DRAFT_638390 [Pyrenochaeta sp. DS3sAY3a]
MATPRVEIDNVQRAMDNLNALRARIRADIALLRANSALLRAGRAFPAPISQILLAVVVAASDGLLSGEGHEDVEGMSTRVIQAIIQRVIVEQEGRELGGDSDEDTEEEELPLNNSSDALNGDDENGPSDYEEALASTTRQFRAAIPSHRLGAVPGTFCAMQLAEDDERGDETFVMDSDQEMHDSDPSGDEDDGDDGSGQDDHVTQEEAQDLLNGV